MTNNTNMPNNIKPMKVLEDFKIMYLEGLNQVNILHQVKAGVFSKNVGLPELPVSLGEVLASPQIMGKLSKPQQAAFLTNYVIGTSLCLAERMNPKGLDPAGTGPEKAEEMFGLPVKLLPSVSLVSSTGMRPLLPPSDRQLSPLAPRVMLFDKSAGKDKTYLALAAWIPPALTGKASRLVLTDDISMPPSFLSWKPTEGRFSSELLFGLDVGEQNNKAITNALHVENASRSFKDLMSSPAKNRDL